MSELEPIQPAKSLRVLLIGDSCIDRYHYGTCERLSEEAPVPILRVLEAEDRGGMALNVKSNLEGLGAMVEMITNDEKIVKSRYIDRKTRQHLLRADWGEAHAPKPLSKADLDGVDFDSFDAIVLSDYDKGFLCVPIIKNILGRSKNKKVFVDSKKSDLSCYEDCILKINESEFKRASHFPKNCELIVTLGERGATYKEEVYPTKKVEVFDVSGAGDTFLSALAYYNITGASVRDSISWSVKYATYVVQKSGTYALTSDDVARIENEGI